MSISNHIIQKFIEGEKSAIEKVYLEYKNLMFFVIANYISNKDDADDVLSDSFLKAVEHNKDIKDPSKLKSFLCAIAKNEALNFLKKNKELPTDIIDQMYGEEDRINTLLNTIEPLLTNKETIVVYYRLGFSYSWKEVEEETHIPESTARRIYKGAMDKLRKELL